MNVFPGALFKPAAWSDEVHRLIVVSDEPHNRGSQVIVVPVWSAQFERRSRMPSCVVFKADSRRFEKNCYAKAYAIATLSKADLGEQLESLTDVELHEVHVAVYRVLGIDWP